MDEENKQNYSTGATNSTSSSYRPVVEFTTSNKNSKKNNSSFGKTVFVPFLSGIIGGTVVIGTCFGVPSVRDCIFEKANLKNTVISNSSSSSSSNKDVISLKDYNETGVGVAAKVLPSVVGISVEFPVSSIFNRGTTTTSASGSGIIISEDGYILTNNHIVSSSSSSFYYEVGEASKVEVYLYNDETPYEATIVGTDEQTDIAVIKLDKEGLTAAQLGDSDSVKAGEFAMTVGNPLGFESTVCSGTISAVNRKVPAEGKTYTLMQTDAAINSGNSGGALVNSKGEVIGINTLKLSGTGIEGMGFAIPINSAKPIFEQLIEYKKVKRPYIGISGRDLTEDLAKANNLVVGVYVVSVEDFSAAELAGIKSGDVVIELDGSKVTTMDELNEIKNKHSIGETLTVKVVRDGTEKELSITLKEQ